MPDPFQGFGPLAAGFKAPLHRLDQAQQDREIVARTEGDSHRVTLEAVWDFLVDRDADEER